MNSCDRINTKYLYKNKYSEEFIEFESKDYLKKDSLKTIIVKDGMILPLKKVHGGPLMGVGGVLDQSGNYVEQSAQIGKGDTLPRFCGKYDYDENNVAYLDETVIYIGAFPMHWGHFLVDMAYRFWYFDECASINKVVYCSEKDEISGVYAEFLALLGIPGDKLFRITIPTRVREIIVPEQGYMACDYFTIEYKDVFKKVVASVREDSLVSYDKVYMSRGHFKDAKAKEIGERNIEKNFAENGYKILYMEELSLWEQIFYINHAKKIAALSGTLCHNVVFANPEAELIILNKTHIINTHQVLIDQMMDINVYYVDVYIEPFRKFPVSYGEGPFWVSCSKLKDFFGDNGMLLNNEGIFTKMKNGVKYITMCIGIVLYDLYSRLYYKICEFPVIIKMLRKIRLAVTKSNN